MSASQTSHLAELQERLTSAVRPFDAASINRAKLIEVLSRRAPDINWDQRLPAIPVDVTSFLKDPSTAWQHVSGKVVNWSDAARTEFEKAAAVGAVVTVDADDESAPLLAAVCPVFTIEQQGGKVRLIFDLRVLNEHSIPPPSFELDTIYDLPAYLAAHPDITVTSKIDLTKAYWKVPVTGGSQPLFGCRGPSAQLHRWTCLPFGWTHAPHLFQSITAAFRDAWRAVGIRCCVYLDDFIFFSESVDTHLAAMDTVTADLLAAGWQLTPEKCPIHPVHSITYLGIEVNVLERSFSLADERIEQLISGAQALLRPSQQPLADLATFIGRANFARVVLPRCGFFLVHLYAQLPHSGGHANLDLSLDPDPDHPLAPSPIHRRRDIYTGRVTIADAAREELTWWCTTARQRLRTHAPWDRLATARVWMAHGAPVPTGAAATGRSDASDSGVGSSWQHGESVSRHYDLLPASLRGTSSTSRELYGAARLIEAMPPMPPRALVRIVLDSQSSVYTVAGGSACIGTVLAARRLDTALHEADVDAAFEWAPRELLDAEDAYSRLAVADASFCTIPPKSRAFLLQWARFGQAVDVECFASGAEHSAPTFGTRWPAAGSSGDGVALLRLHDGGRSPPRVWAFPPFPLARPTVTAALLAVTERPTARILLVLPSDAHLAACLTAAGWHSTPGPRHVVLPNASFRAPSRPLVAFASPACRSTPPQQEVRSPTPRRD
jgi:hypothetical protein